MKIYNKLVRDKIPEVIKATGKECEFEIAPKEERYKPQLVYKAISYISPFCIKIVYNTTKMEYLIERIIN